MGEYLKYRSEEIKIGTLYNLYYATYPKYIYALKTGKLSKLPNNGDPKEYAEPDSEFRFRFPFPDEDNLPLGTIKGNYDRGIPIRLDTSVFTDLFTLVNKDAVSQIEIVQQKLIHRASDNQLCLAVIGRLPKTREYFRVEDDTDIKKILSQVIKHHIQNEINPEAKLFYRTMALRILKGYRLTPSVALQRKARNSSRKIHSNSSTLKRKR